MQITKEMRIYVAGHTGLVGSAICRTLKCNGYENILTKTHQELDLCNQESVRDFFVSQRPDVVILAAAKVGGIYANATYPAEFIYDNIILQTNVIDAAYRYGCKKLLFLGSSCIYPKYCQQPIKEEYLLTGALEPTNEAYALAKIAGIKMCQSYRKQYGFDAICAMPTNLYGPGDNYDLTTGHVVPAMIRKFYTAIQTGQDSVTIWGTGSPLREFLHVDDLAEACIFLLEHYSESDHINVGSGKECTIIELANRIAGIAAFKGKIIRDLSKPDGTPRKLLDSTKLFNIGWQPKISFQDGLKSTYNAFKYDQENYKLDFRR